MSGKYTYAYWLAARRIRALFSSWKLRCVKSLLSSSFKWPLTFGLYSGLGALQVSFRERSTGRSDAACSLQFLSSVRVIVQQKRRDARLPYCSRPQSAPDNNSSGTFGLSRRGGSGPHPSAYAKFSFGRSEEKLG